MRAIIMVLLGFALAEASEGAPLKRMLMVGHRGAGGAVPENTMAALRHAWGGGALFCEVDVRGTRDGVPVLMHDETVDRTTDGAGPLKLLPYSTVRGLDAGQGKEGYTGERVPTLEVVLKAAKAFDRGLVLHVKEPSTFRTVRSLVERCGLKPSRAVLLVDGKYIADAVRAFAGMANPRWSTVSSPATTLKESAFAYYRKAGISAMVFFYHGSRPTAADVAAVQGEGFLFGASVTGGPSDAASLREMGVNLYLTDFPVKAAEVLGGGAAKPSG